MSHFDGSIHVAVPCIKGGVPHLTPDQVNAILSAEEGERILMAAYFDIATCIAPCGQFTKARLPIAKGEGNQSNASSSPLLQFFGYQPEAAATYNLIMGLRSSALGAHTISGGGGGKEAAAGSALAAVTAAKEGNGGSSTKNNSKQQTTAATAAPIIYGETDSGRLSLTMENWQNAVEVLQPKYAISLHNAVNLEQIITVIKKDQDTAATLPPTTTAPSSPAAVTGLVTMGKKKVRLTAEKNSEWGMQCANKFADGRTTVVHPLSAVVLQSTTICTPQQSSTVADAAPTTEQQKSPEPLPAAIFVDSANLGESLHERFSTLSRLHKEISPSYNPLLIAAGDSVAGILLAYTHKISIVDCSFPFMMATKGHALNLGMMIDFIEGQQKTTVGGKRAREEGANNTPLSFIPPLVLDLRNPQHRLDFTPLCSSGAKYDSPTSPCHCYTCSRHTTGYIFHLLNVQEMNSTTLLSIHNLAQTVALCRKLRHVAKKVGGQAAREAARKTLEQFYPY